MPGRPRPGFAGGSDRARSVAGGWRALLILGVAIAAPAVAQTGGTGRDATAVEPVAAEGRQRLSFNAGWRFTRGDVAAAREAGFDDRGWERVGLPHSFGTPYFQAASFYEGYGWYRKDFTLPALPRGRRLTLEFEGAFQQAAVFVNGIAVGGHRGGYTGFPIDITAAVRPGRNVVAVRVDNVWRATQAPRAGEHVFSGGLYRDVWLVATDAVHVPWTGIAVTTPGVDAGTPRVALDTEVRNDAAAPATVVAVTQVLDARDRVVASLPDRRVTVAPGATTVVTQRSAPIAGVALWTPETPALYRAVTTLSVGGTVRDRVETPFGFRWFRWTADRGFFLNGTHRYLRGANVHQDQAGWGDAVTNGAIARDVAMMKAAGFDLIRGSHYPHDPAFTDATDRQGMLFLSEAPFWGTGGFREDSGWTSPAYPTDPGDRPAFEASVRQQLTEMIRIHRNHPSVLGWSMGKETFFSAPAAMPALRRFLRELVALTHRLDPTRAAVIGGAQRGETDRIGDVAGYNGDGATLFLDPGVPSMVTEYGSTIADRPGAYAPGWGDLPLAAPKTGGCPWRFAWRSGEAIWAGFDHGSIAGRQFGSMGIVDYARLPKRAWYWYRNAYRGIAPPAWPKAGTPAALRITASAPQIAAADGTDDVQLVVTVVDAHGRALSDSPPVRLAIESGPGELPTGRAIDFAPDGDIPIRDGQAAIALRSWQRGTTRLRATSPGLVAGTLDIATTAGPRFVAGVTPLVADRPYRADDRVGDGAEAVFGTDNPTGASSSAPGHSPRLANDGDAATYWAPAAGDADPWVSISTERILRFRRVEITFPQDGGYGVVVEVARPGGRWEVLAQQAPGTAGTARVRRMSTTPLVGERIRARPLAPAGLPVGIAEVRLFATLTDR